MTSNDLRYQLGMKAAVLKAHHEALNAATEAMADPSWYQTDAFDMHIDEEMARFEKHWEIASEVR